MSETCHHCHQPIPRRELVYAEDHAGDEQPLHATCYALVTDPRYGEHLEEQRALRRYTDEERARI